LFLLGNVREVNTTLVYKVQHCWCMLSAVFSWYCLPAVSDTTTVPGAVMQPACLTPAPTSSSHSLSCSSSSSSALLCWPWCHCVAISYYIARCVAGCQQQLKRWVAMSRDRLLKSLCTERGGRRPASSSMCVTPDIPPSLPWQAMHCNPVSSKSSCPHSGCWRQP